MKQYREEDFDAQGNLKARSGTWWVLFLQSHAWWLMALDMSVKGEQLRMLPLIYPTTETLIAGLICGVFAFLFLFIYPFRHIAPRMMQVAYGLLILGCLSGVCWTALNFYEMRGSHDSELWLSLLLMEIACVMQMWPDCRNRHTYLWPEEILR